MQTHYNKNLESIFRPCLHDQKLSLPSPTPKKKQTTKEVSPTAQNHITLTKVKAPR